MDRESITNSVLVQTTVPLLWSSGRLQRDEPVPGAGAPLSSLPLLPGSGRWGAIGDYIGRLDDVVWTVVL